MANKITDETLEYVAALSKLELSQEEKETARTDMERMLAYIDQLNELDTTQTEPDRNERCFLVPKTIV